MPQTNGVKHFTTVLFVTTLKHIVVCTQDTHRRTGIICDRVITENRHDEHCDVFLNFSVYSSRVGNSYVVILLEAVYMVTCFGDSSSVYVPQYV